MAATYKLDPLQHQVPITNPDGTPTPEFIRKWQQQVLGSDSSGTALAALAATQVGGDGTVITPAPAPLSDGDITLTLADTAVTPATYGDASNSAQITIDQQGRITAAVDVPIAGGGGSGSYFSPKSGADTTTFATVVTNGSAAGAQSDDATRGLVMGVNSGGSDDWYINLKATSVPGSGTTTHISRVIYTSLFAGVPGAGMVLRNSANGRMLFLGFDGPMDNAFTIAAQQWVNDTFGATITSQQLRSTYDIWLRIDVSSAGAVDFYISTTGARWALLGSTALATYLTAAGGALDQVGFGAKYHTGGCGLVVPFYSDDGSIG